jgi:hypothetical protein
MPEEKSELVERGNEIFDRVVRPQVDVEEDAQKYVAIDTEAESIRPSRSTATRFRRSTASKNAIPRREDASGSAEWGVATRITSGGDF